MQDTSMDRPVPAVVGLAAVGAGVTATVAALAAVTCCVLPLSLAVLGVGAGWLGGFAFLVPYQPMLAGAAALVLAAAWLLAARRRGGGWRVPRARTTAVLAAATLLTALAVSRQWWEPPAMEWLWQTWTSR